MWPTALQPIWPPGAKPLPPDPASLVVLPLSNSTAPKEPRCCCGSPTSATTPTPKPCACRWSTSPSRAADPTSVSPITPAADDRTLIEAAQAGDQRALETLLRRHQDRIYAICRRLA